MSWGDWRDQAACAGEPAETFFPAAYEPNLPAKRICATCTVRETCLEFALAENIQHGIWGGISIQERRAIRARRLKAAS